MNRRTFLSMLSAGAFGTMTLDVDKLLWVPGAKTIFLPQVMTPTHWTMSERVFFMSPEGVYAYVGDALESVARAIDYDLLMAYRSEVGLGVTL